MAYLAYSYMNILPSPSVRVWECRSVVWERGIVGEELMGEFMVTPNKVQSS